MGLAWVLFILSAIAAAIVITQYGVYEIELPYAGIQKHYDYTIIVGALSQALAMFMIAGVFTMLHGIHESIVEVHRLSKSPE